MNRWEHLYKEVIMSFLVYFGLTLVGVMIYTAFVISSYGIRLGLFMEVLTDTTIKTLYTPILYSIALLTAMGERLIGIVIFHRAIKR